MAVRLMRTVGRCMLALMCAVALNVLAAEPQNPGVPLVIGHRTIHIFRAPLGAFSAEERADGARLRIARTFEDAKEGWTSVKPTEGGFLVEIDGTPMFTVAIADARKLAGETPEDLANQASRQLQRAWTESRERRNPQANLLAALKALGALALLIAGLFGMARLARASRGAISARLADDLKRLSGADIGARTVSYFLGAVLRAITVVTWSIGLFAVFLFLIYALAQFAATRPLAENMARSLGDLALHALVTSAGALPGLFIAAVIFLIARVTTQLSTGLFEQISSGRLHVGTLDSHTAPVTRRIVNAAIWLFSLAMAYPYLPGAQTEAFKALSVMLGIMVSIGASGLVGQVASGMMLVYTRALKVGEYVRIQDSEGTVTQLGLLVTRLRTGMGEEIALPNALVLANVTRNFSRATAGNGYVLDTTLTIGYDTPWRQVHAMLLESAKQLPQIAAEPAPQVHQTALSDFYVAYRLVVHVTADTPASRARVSSDLNAAIQDTFNRYGVQIMSPHYENDPAAPKVVPQSAWYAAPAAHKPERPA